MAVLVIVNSLFSLPAADKKQAQTLLPSGCLTCNHREVVYVLRTEQNVGFVEV